MTNGTDGDSGPVADPQPDDDGGTRWPTWSDISRLHHIPSESGEPTEASSSAAKGAPTSTSDGVPEQRRPASSADGPADAMDERAVASDEPAASSTPTTEPADVQPEPEVAAQPDEAAQGADGAPPSAAPRSDDAAPSEPAPSSDDVPPSDETAEPSDAAGPSETAGPREAEQPDVARQTGVASGPDDEQHTDDAGLPQRQGDGAGAEATVSRSARGAAEAAGTDAAASTAAVPVRDEPKPPAAAPARDEPKPSAAAPVGTEPTPPVAAPPSPDQSAAHRRAPAAAAAPEPADRPLLPARTSAFPTTSAGAAASPHVDGGAVPVVTREPSVLDAFEPDDGRRRWPRQLAVVLGVVVVLVAAYAGASYALGHRVPRGATVAGVDVGGLSQSAAVDRLTSRLGNATTGALAVKAGDQQSQIDPAKAGLTFDAVATVRRLVGVKLLQPVRLWNQVLGVGAQPAVTVVDAGALHTAVQQLADALQVDPVNGTIVFADGTAHATPAKDGTDLDVAGAEKAIRDGWLVGARPLVLPTTSVAPDITQAETDAALTEVAQRVAGAPVTVTVADRSVTLPASTLVANASFVAQNGKLVLQMNGPALVGQVVAQTPGLVTAASDAHFQFQNDAPVLVPGTPGTTIDPDALASAVATAASSPTQRTATVQLVPSDPSQSTAALQALGIKEIVSEFATPLTSEPHRTVNITVGAGKINGVLVKPGDTFSLGQSLSPIDPSQGYIDAGAIVDGDHVQALGGGLSQVSTTTYNAAFFAGFEDVAHTPHSEWFTRYPEGREATIFYPTLDMKWKNNTPYGALIQAWVAGNQMHVRIWGTKYWTVTSTTGPRSNVHAPTTVYSQSPTCTAQSAGNPGFTVTVTRQLALNGEVKQTSSRTTTYKAQDTIICGPPPSTPSPAPTP